MFGSCIVESCSGLVCYKISQLAGQQIQNIQSKESQQKSERHSRICLSFCLVVFLFFFLISLSTILHLGLCRRFELESQIKLPKMHRAVNLCPKKAFFLAAGQGSTWQNLCAAACLLIGLIGTVWAELFIYCNDQTPLSPLTNFSPAGFYSSVWLMTQNKRFTPESDI